MPRKVKAVDLLVEQIVPKDLQGMLNTYSAKEMNNFLLVLSQKYPDKYVDISHRLAKAGLDVTYYQGDSMGLEDTEQVLDRDHILKQMDSEIDELQKEYRNDPEEFRKRRENVWLKYNDLILKKTTQEANRKGNAMGMSVMSGARGKPQQVQAMLSTPGLYQDANGKIIPIFVRNSFSEGLRPLELMAGTFGARSAVVSTKRATAQGGDIGKLMAQATGKLLVTEKDCGVRNGLKYDLDAEALPGKVLAADTGSLKRGTILDRHALGILQKDGIKKVVARSPITCKADGLCAKCVGKMMDSNDLPQVGDHVGITAANALSEPLTQGALCLHEDTKVKMGDGKPKPIKDIKVGDKVMGADKSGKYLEVTVLDVFENAKKYCYTFTIGDKKVTCSLQHEFPDEKGVKKPIGKFRKGENVLTAEGVVPLMRKDDYGMARTFDLHVDHEDHLFVLDNWLIVSNSAKHVAGQAKGKQGYGGLDIVTQFVQSPEEYQHRATVASVAGKVEQINPAPQGGVFIRVGGQDHYAPQGYDPMVKVGDDVDEGDQLSDGLMDVRDVVRYKGLGAGRKYYVDRLQQIYKDSGLNAHPKNLEIVARGALNTVTLDDFMDGMDALPDDAVEYNKVTRVWEPENEIQTSPDDTARNTYLSRDTLHYTAGTKLGRAQLKDIRDAGITQIHTVKDKPPFTSNMDRLRVASHYNDDWLASMSSSYLKKQLGEGAVRGADTNVNENQHWAPRLAYGKGFGEKIRETGKF